jgi:hypothetical protein
MKKINFSKSFLAIGKTQESKEASEGFKRYVGVGSTFVKGVQPTKKEIDEFFGFESQTEPEYVKDGENGKEAHITFLLQTDPETCNGIELKSRAMFTLRATPAYNRDQTKVQVIDQYGNYTWVDTEDAKAGKAITHNGNPAKIDTKYRMACVGECDLVAFLKKYLCVPDAFNYVNGTWMKKEDADDYKFALENIKDYFKGDFKELKEAIALQPNNKVKMLYGVRTNDEGKQYQAVCTRGELILPNAASANALTKLEKDLVNAKQNGAYQNTDYRVCELQEWDVKPTNLEQPASDTGDMPFDAPSADNGGMPWD